MTLIAPFWWCWCHKFCAAAAAAARTLKPSKIVETPSRNKTFNSLFNFSWVVPESLNQGLEESSHGAALPWNYPKYTQLSGLLEVTDMYFSICFIISLF